MKKILPLLLLLLTAHLAPAQEISGFNPGNVPSAGDIFITDQTINGTLTTVRVSGAQLQQFITSGLTITPTTGTLTLASGKTLTSNDSLTFAGTDGSTLNIGAGGTLGSAAFQPTSAFQPYNSATTTQGNAAVTGIVYRNGTASSDAPATQMEMETAIGSSVYQPYSTVLGLYSAATPNSVALTALGLVPNAASALVVADQSSVVRHGPAVSVGPAATAISCIGDSITFGSGVPGDPRQSYPAILSSLGFALNGSTVHNFGHPAYTTHSILAFYTTSSAVGYWLSGSTSYTAETTTPHAVAAPYAIILAGANDYFGVYLNATESTTSETLTGLSQTSYFTDYAGYARPLTVGDAVTGTGIPPGTTVTSVGSGSVGISAYPTVAATNLLTFTPSPTSSGWLTTLKSLIAAAKADGSKVLLATIPPANNTSTPGNGYYSQGAFQANRLIYNAAIRSLTFDGAGSDPDALVDIANLSDFTAFNSAIFYTDMLHPNFHGNAVMANAFNNALLSLVTPLYIDYGNGQESILDSQLQNDVALTDLANTWSLPQTFGTSTVPETTTFNGPITISGDNFGQPYPTINFAPISSSSYINFFTSTAMSAVATQEQFYADGHFSISNLLLGTGIVDNANGSMEIDVTNAAGLKLSSTANPCVLAFGAIGTGHDDINFDCWQEDSSIGSYKLIDTYDTGSHVQVQITGNATAANSLFEIPNGSFKVDAGPATALAFNSIAAQTTVAGSTGGSAIFSEPLAGTSDKKIIINLVSLNGTASYTFPTAFAFAPAVTTSSTSSYATTVTTTGVTVTGSTTSGTVILEGD